MGVKKWPPPTAGQSLARDDCGNDNTHGPYRWNAENRIGKGQGVWRRDKGALGTARKVAYAAAKGMTTTELNVAAAAAKGMTTTEQRVALAAAKGMTTTELRLEQLKAAGETRAESEIRKAAVHGKTVTQLKREREEAYLEKHGWGRRPSRDGWGNIAAAHQMLKLPHVASMAWQGEYTGADGTVSTADSDMRDGIMASFYRLYDPQQPRGGTKYLLDNHAQCGDYLVVDTEFRRIGGGDVDTDDQDGVDPRSAYARFYDISIVLVDCRGNVKHLLFHERNDDHSPLSEAIKQRAVSILRGDDASALRGFPMPQHRYLLAAIHSAFLICWGNPELGLFEMAGRRNADRSDGVDVRAELSPFIPGCRPRGGAYPFSLSQNVLVPFLGIRLGPKHKARQDTYDEAITITTILRGAINHLMLVDSKNKQQKLISNLFLKRPGGGGGGGGGGSGTGGGGGGGGGGDSEDDFE